MIIKFTDLSRPAAVTVDALRLLDINAVSLVTLMFDNIRIIDSINGFTIESEENNE